LLLEIQENAGLSRKDMASKLGITRQGYENLLREGAGCRAQTLLRAWHIAREDLKWSAKRFLERLEEEYANDHQDTKKAR